MLLKQHHQLYCYLAVCGDLRQNTAVLNTKSKVDPASDTLQSERTTGWKIEGKTRLKKVNRLRRTRETKHSWPSLKFNRIFTKTCSADIVQDFKNNHSLSVTRMLCQGWRYSKSPRGCLAKSLKFRVGCSALPLVFSWSHNTVNSLAALLLLWVALIHLCIEPVPLKLKKNIVYSLVSSGLDTWGSISPTVDGTTGPSKYFQWNVQD